MLILALFFRDFRGFLRPCEALRQVKKQQIKVKFLDLGSHNSEPQHDMCPKLFSKITPPYPTPPLYSIVLLDFYFYFSGKSTI